MYVIQRISDGKFVTPPGSPRSYTKDLRKAVTFSTQEDADEGRCPENERVVPLEAVVQRPYLR